MSWSINVSGTTTEVNAELQRTSETLQGQSKVEFDDALPHLQAIVNENFDKDATVSPTIELVASGHGYAVEGEQKNRTLRVTLTRVG